MSYYKYAVEAKRLLGGWSRGAIWAVRPCDFRKFLNYVNAHGKGKIRVRRIHGNPTALYTWPCDGEDVE